MIPLIATIILSATGPTLSITLEEPSHIASATVEFTDIKGNKRTFTAYPSTWTAEFPTDATEPGVANIFIGDATEGSKPRASVIVWNRYPMGYKAFKPKLHEPGPVPPVYKFTTWPKNPITKWGWVPKSMAEYIRIMEAKGLVFCPPPVYNSDRKRFDFTWRTK
jgi:hypothetical protein